MRGMTTPIACPALNALRLVDMRTGRSRVVAVMFGPRQAQGQPLVRGEAKILDLDGFRRRRIQQDADLAVAKGAVQGHDRGG